MLRKAPFEIASLPLFQAYRRAAEGEACATRAARAGSVRFSRARRVGPVGARRSTVQPACRPAGRVRSCRHGNRARAPIGALAAVRPAG